MRIAILADLHANPYALQAVLEDASGVEEYWCLGDVVGYGPNPIPGIRFLARYGRSDAWVLGNHDAMLADLCPPVSISIRFGDQGETVQVRGKFLSAEDWHSTGETPLRAILLNRQMLAKFPEEDRWWQQNFQPERIQPRSIVVDGIVCVLVHASQANPLSRYVYPWQTELFVPEEFERLQQFVQSSGINHRGCVVQFYGHTHVPAMVRWAQGSYQAERIFPGCSFALQDDYYLINPGSVGQPRDLDPRAAYLILDTTAATVTFHRVRYNVERASQELLANGYPQSLARRLLTAAARERETPDEWLRHFQEAKER